MGVSKCDLYVAIRAALHAGQEISRIYAGADDELDVEQKADDSPLTVADRNANSIILSYLSDTAHPVLSEEGGFIPFDERKNWKTFWMVDPLDGTKDFLRKNGEFTVNIALISNSEPVLGVIYIPVKQVLYYATKGAGAFKIRNCSYAYLQGMETLLDKKERLPLADKHEGVIVASSRSYVNVHVAAFVDNLREQGCEVSLIVCGSSIKLGMVAEGSADIYPRFAPCMEWDTAAGHAIVREAGCEIYQLNGNTPLTYNKEDLTNPWFVAERVRK